MKYESWHAYCFTIPMTYGFDTVGKSIVLSYTRNLIAMISLLSMVFASNISFSATAGINFSGYVRPKATSKTVLFPDQIYSFTDKVALPIFPAISSSDKNSNVRVYMGKAKSGKVSQQVHFETISFNTANSIRQQAVVIDMPNENQVVYVCYGKAKTISWGCVLFNTVKVN